MNNMMSLPPLEYFRSFVTFVESANITEAATKLQISQPLLTKHLKNLEEHYGLALFEFHGRKKILTFIGRQLYESVQQQFLMLSTEINMTLLKAQEGRPLNIGGRREILENIVLNLHYRGSLSFHALDSDSIEKGLKNRTLDIGITQREIDSDNLIRKKTWKDEFVLAYNSAIKIKTDGNIVLALEDLAIYRCYAYYGNFILEKIFAQAERPRPTTVTMFSDWRTITEGISNSKSWGFVPNGYVAKNNKVKFLPLPVGLKFETEFFVFYQKELSKLAWFKDVIQQIISVPT